jgi:hypothetical protein
MGIFLSFFLNEKKYLPNSNNTFGCRLQLNLDKVPFLGGFGPKNSENSHFQKMYFSFCDFCLIPFDSS